MVRDSQAAPAEPVCFDRAAGYYDDTRGFPPGVEHRVARLIAQTAGLGPDSRVLEVGIGTGRIAVPLARQVRGVVGVDLSRQMMERLVTRRAQAHPAESGWVELCLGDATRLPFPDDCFDAAIGVHVFHLIPGWRDVISQVARVLRPGAPLVNAGDKPRMTAVWEQWRKQTGRDEVVPDVGLARADLVSFLEQSGWQPTGEVQDLAFSQPLYLPDYLEQFNQRIWSTTWRLSDTQLEELVDGLRRALLELYGDLDQTIEMQLGFWARAYLPPSS